MVRLSLGWDPRGDLLATRSAEARRRSPPRLQCCGEGLQACAVDVGGASTPRGAAAAMSAARVAALAAPARVVVSGAGSSVVNGSYARRSASAVPAAFARVCRSSGWDAGKTWERLNGPRDWWEASNASYIYFNCGDRMWWLDSGVTGLGLYVSGVEGSLPPVDGWKLIGDGALPLPTVHVDSGSEAGEPSA